MAALGIYEDDLREEFILGSGAGGQKINKTHSCVRLRHLPSGTEIRCQASRSRGKNRIIARETLCQTLERERARKRQEKARRQALARNRARKPGPAAKKRRRKDKQRHSEKKSLRKPPSAG